MPRSAANWRSVGSSRWAMATTLARLLWRRSSTAPIPAYQWSSPMMPTPYLRMSPDIRQILSALKCATPCPGRLPRLVAVRPVHVGVPGREEGGQEVALQRPRGRVESVQDVLGREGAEGESAPGRLGEPHPQLGPARCRPLGTETDPGLPLVRLAGERGGGGGPDGGGPAGQLRSEGGQQTPRVEDASHRAPARFVVLLEHGVLVGRRRGEMALRGEAEGYPTDGPAARRRHLVGPAAAEGERR